MTEPETCSSEFHSDLEKSAFDSENGSRRKSISDNNTDTSAYNFMVKLNSIKFINRIILFDKINLYSKV